MGWTRRPGRRALDRRRPCLEPLETRQLLSIASAKPTSSAAVNSDGSTNFDNIIGASATRANFHVDGSGQTVAVIDTGVDYNNPALGGGLGAGHKVLAGVDFTGSPNGVLPTWQHGTGVAGLVASSDASHPGIAPGANIVALRVFGDDNSGSFDEIASALNWVVENHSQFNITVVNLSVSDGGNYTSNQFSSVGVGQQITQAIGALDQLNIPVVVASGNSFDGKTQGIGFPSIVSDAISVTATDARDQFASNAQRLGSAKGGTSAVKIAAPGVGITAPSGDNGTTTEDGTSFAAPLVSGSIALLQQMYENAYHTLPTVAQIDKLLQQGAVTVHDGVTGVDVGRLDILRSATLLNQQIAGSTGSGPTSPAPSNPTNTPQTQVFVNGVSQGFFATSQLAAKYPNLFAFLKGPVASLRIWAPAGSSVDLGPHPASFIGGKGMKPSAHLASKAFKGTTEVKKVRAAAVTHYVAVAKHPAPLEKSNPIKSFFSKLFPF